MSESNNIIPADKGSLLKQLTTARISLGRSGVSLPTSEVLSFKADHAMARDAIYTPMDIELISRSLQQDGIDFICLKSKAADRKEYLLRPDKGRVLNTESVNQLTTLAKTNPTICITIADGLSPLAVNLHAVPLLRRLLLLFNEAGLPIAPVCLAAQGRVAISDETGALTGAALSIILIGERPGLSSPDSLGVYITYAPAPGTTDERRNCISNIRPGGLDLETAANKIVLLVMAALNLAKSGVGLKEGVQVDNQLPAG
jgi:ethanolamine ammonia-lyase small subunit